MKRLRRKNNSILKHICAIPLICLAVILLLCIPISYIFKYFFIVMIICITDYYLLFKKFNKQKNKDSSFIVIVEILSTLFGLFFGLIFAILSFEFLVKLIKQVFRKDYYWYVMFVYSIVYIAFSIFLSWTFLKFGNFITDNSLSLNVDFKVKKPDAEKSFNRITVLFISIVSIISFFVFKAKINIVDVSFSMENLTDTIILLVFEVLLYVFAVMTYVYSLTKSQKISKNYSEAIVMCTKSFLVMSVSLIGLYSIIQSQPVQIQPVQNSFYICYLITKNIVAFKLWISVLATSLYPILDLWKYVHNEIKKNKRYGVTKLSTDVALGQPNPEKTPNKENFINKWRLINNNNEPQLTTAELIQKSQDGSLKPGAYTWKKLVTPPDDTDNNYPAPNPVPVEPTNPVENKDENKDKDENNNNGSSSEKTVVLMHNAYLYDNTGTRANQIILKIGSKLMTYGKTTISGRNFYVLNDKGNSNIKYYIAAGNVDPVVRKLKHNAYIYNQYGDRQNKKVLKKGSTAKTYGDPIKIKNKKYYIVDKNRFVKKANF